MSWVDNLAAPLPAVMVKVGTIAPGSPLMVSWDKGEPQEPTWSDSFDLVLASRGVAALAGVKVLLLLPERQPPFISALVMGGPTNATI